MSSGDIAAAKRELAACGHPAGFTTRLAYENDQPAEVAVGPDAKVTDRDLFGDEAPANLPPVQAQPVAFQPNPPVATLPPGGATLPGAAPPPALPPDALTRKITVFRSVKSEQYDVPQELE